MLSLSKHGHWAGLLLLAACAKPAAEPVGETIACAVDGATKFAQVCTIEDGGYQNGLTTIVIHHPDGKFRRFLQPGDGTFRAADGSEEVVTTRSGDVFEAVVGTDRYRFIVKPNVVD